MSQNPFQPWKQNFNNSNQFNYRKNDCDILSSFKMTKSSDAGPSAGNLSILSHPFDLNGNGDGLQLYHHHQSNPAMTNSQSSSNSVSDSDPPLTPQHHLQQQQQLLSPVAISQQPKASLNSATSSKFSIFSQLLNLNKIQSFDNLLMNATLDDDDLSNDKPHGIRKLMEQAIRYATTSSISSILESKSQYYLC